MALAAIPLSACALTEQDVVYAGEITPTAGTCDAPARATLTLRHRAILFAPSSGVLALSGSLKPDGRISATLQQVGADKAPYRLTLTAQLAGNTVTGDFVTPRCRYMLQLHKV